MWVWKLIRFKYTVWMFSWLWPFGNYQKNLCGISPDFSFLDVSGNKLIFCMFFFPTDQGKWPLFQWNLALHWNQDFELISNQKFLDLRPNSKVKNIFYRFYLEWNVFSCMVHLFIADFAMILSSSCERVWKSSSILMINLLIKAPFIFTQ